MLDSSYLHKAAKDSVKLVQIDASEDFKLKITRNEGFPFVDKIMCKSDKDFDSCLNDFKEKT